jgi:nucleotide-binding universal stress UspA family protein
MTIVCGTDFSEAGRPALRAAGALAARTHDPEFYLVHVLDPTVTGELDAENQLRMKTEVTERLAEDARELTSRYGLSHVHPTVRIGSPSEALVEFADINQASWLVVASQGHVA